MNVRNEQISITQFLIVNIQSLLLLVGNQSFLYLDEIQSLRLKTFGIKLVGIWSLRIKSHCQKIRVKLMNKKLNTFVIIAQLRVTMCFFNNEWTQ